MLVGCERPTDPPIDPEPGRLAVSANVAATTIRTMVVTVRAEDIPIPLVKNLVIGENRIASGSIDITVGSGRTIEIDAFDANNIRTHHGEKINVTVLPGINPSMTIVLDPLKGNQPVQATLGSFILTVIPTTAVSVVVDGTAPVRVTITDNATPPNEITPAPGTVAWATTNPALFKVDADLDDQRKATITGIKAGSGKVVATYSGFAETSAVTVTAP
jgi:hypothetical protein